VHPETPRTPARFALVALFILSGSSGLIYQVVWMRMLIRAFGITIHAVSTVVAVFLGGLALGAFLASRILQRRPRNVLRWYAVAELAIGLSAVLCTLASAQLTEVWSAVARSIGSGLTTSLVRFALATAVLLVPTTIMGATLPMITEYVATRSELAGREVGLFYAANTVGAVLGTLGSGFVLLGWLGEIRTVMLAAALNVVIGLIVWPLSARSSPVPLARETSAAPASSEGSQRLSRVLISAYAASGFAALAYEIIWSRLLNLVLGNSVYAFSAMLAVYLLGIAAGSMVMSRFVQRAHDAILVFALLEMAVAFLVVISLHVFVAVGTIDRDPRYTFSLLWSSDDFIALFRNALVIILPVTFILGALFPIAVHSLRATGQASEIVGRLYGWNTVGSILGSLVTGFVAIPLLGTLKTVLVLAFGSLSIGCYLLFVAPSVTRERARLLVLGATLLFVLSASVSFEDPFMAILRSRVPERDVGVAHAEDRAATVSVFETPEKTRDLYINGLYVSSTSFAGHFMMHSPLLLHPRPEKVMLIGMGAGDTFSAAIEHGVDATVVDLASSVVGLYPLMQPDRVAYLKSPKAHIVINDGRNHLLSTSELFDVVLVDGTPPLFASGMVNLYSLEFMALVREHLTPPGIFALWVPLYCFGDDFWMIARNFVETFEHVQLWMAPNVSGILVFGSRQEIIRDRAVLEARQEARQLRSRQPLYDLSQLLSGMPFDEDTIRKHALRYPTVTDDRPRTEFPLFRFLAGETIEATSQFVVVALGREPSAVEPRTNADRALE
jgi:spermidine synthase